MKQNRIVIKILSVALLLCSLLIPMFDAWAGIMPSEYAWTVSTTFETIADEGSSSLNYYGVQLHLCTWILGGILCVAAFMEKRPVIAVSSASGTVALIMVVVNNMNQYGDSWNYLMNFDDGNYSIGYWIVLILFIMCFLFSLIPTKRIEFTEDIPEI